MNAGAAAAAGGAPQGARGAKRPLERAACAAAAGGALSGAQGSPGARAGAADATLSDSSCGSSPSLPSPPSTALHRREPAAAAGSPSSPSSLLGGGVGSGSLVSSRDAKMESFLKDVLADMLKRLGGDEGDEEGEGEAAAAGLAGASHEELEHLLATEIGDRVSDVNSFLWHRVGPVAQAMLAKRLRRDCLLETVAVVHTAPRFRDMAENYRTLFDAFFDTPHLSFQTLNPGALGNVSARDYWILAYYARASCKRAKTDGCLQLGLSGRTSIGKSTLFEAPLSEISHHYVSDSGVGRFKVDEKPVLFFHDVDVSDLCLGRDRDLLKTLARGEVTKSKVHSTTVVVLPIHLFYTSNTRMFTHYVPVSEQCLDSLTWGYANRRPPPPQPQPPQQPSLEERAAAREGKARAATPLPLPPPLGGGEEAETGEEQASPSTFPAPRQQQQQPVRGGRRGTRRQKRKPERPPTHIPPLPLQAAAAREEAAAAAKAAAAAASLKRKRRHHQLQIPQLFGSRTNFRGRGAARHASSSWKRATSARGDSRRFTIHPSDLTMTAKNEEHIEALQARFLECFVQRRPRLDTGLFPKYGSFRKAHAVLGIYTRILDLLERVYSPSDFFSPGLPLYVITGLASQAASHEKRMAQAPDDANAGRPPPVRERVAALAEKYFPGRCNRAERDSITAHLARNVKK